MLSAKSHEIVSATAGVVAEHAVEITSCFYPRMFAAHPELLNIFNRADQALGEQPQALAASVVAYAVHLIDPDAPDFSPVLERIAHKHVSLGITAPQYTIVGRHLLAAVAEVLGDAVTPEVAAAWDEVYWLLALELAAEEARLYALGKIDPNHPWRDYRVTQRIDEIPGEVVTLVLSPVDGLPVPAHLPGQYVSINAVLPDGSTQPRQYTISAGPRPQTLQVTVRRVRGAGDLPDGVVSNLLHDATPVGSVLAVSTPCGDVVLEQADDPLVLVSAGVGITPMAAILDHLVQTQPQRPVVIAHADRSADVHAMRDTIRAYTHQLDSVTEHVWYEDGAHTTPGARPGRMNLGEVDIPANAAVFMCGPLPFMRSARLALIDQGVAPDAIRYEVFGPDLWAQNPGAN